MNQLADVDEDKVEVLLRTNYPTTPTVAFQDLAGAFALPLKTPVAHSSPELDPITINA